MTQGRVVIVVAAAFVAGLVSASLVPALRAQGKVTELKQVDLGSWCEGKEAGDLDRGNRAAAPVEALASRLLVRLDARGVPGEIRRREAPQTFRVGDVTQENPGEISESDILTPTRVLLFRILQKGQPATTRISQ